jgi:hypothetical protein
MREGRRASAPFPPPRFFKSETTMNIMVWFNWKKMTLRRELKTNFILEFPVYRSAFGTQDDGKAKTRCDSQTTVNSWQLTGYNSCYEGQDKIKNNSIINITQTKGNTDENAGKRRTVKVRNTSPSSLGSQKQGWWLSSEQGQLKEKLFITILKRQNTMETPEVFSVNRNV